MTERPLTVDAREAKGLHDGTISRIVRVVEPQPDHAAQPKWMFVPTASDGHSGIGWYCSEEEYPEEGSLFYECPFGVPGDRLRAVCEPGEPCEHRGCLSHVTHVCEGCGRGHAGILLDLTDVRVLRIQEIGLGGVLLQREIAQAYGEDTWLKNKWVWLASVAKVEAANKPLAPNPVDG